MELPVGTYRGLILVFIVGIFFLVRTDLSFLNGNGQHQSQDVLRSEIQVMFKQIKGSIDEATSTLHTLKESSFSKDETLKEINYTLNSLKGFSVDQDKSLNEVKSTLNSLKGSMLENEGESKSTNISELFIGAAEAVCSGKNGLVWEQMCGANFFKSLHKQLSKKNDNTVRIIQIGAHTGWERNDPFMKGVTALLSSLPHELRQRIEYNLIEASPFNYEQLVKNVKNHNLDWNIKTVNAGIIPTPEQKGLKFYSMKSTLDTESGLDSKTGKKLPYWVTQIGSFSKSTMTKPMHANVFKENGLNISDYIVAVDVKTITVTELLADHDILFLMIDTEGLDCDIVRAIPNKELAPRFLLFERKHCKEGDAVKHLKSLGFVTQRSGSENMFAYKEDT
mmetsp:Transcript_22675/g.27785  ORF Transcript_22675/g.27785 Transcript_22675/m.27785 type:complete len:393 (-) Transcript_22675:262-1440(-)|eukprot:CAMPEP_0204826966 /NCGR_PEP_ID=MMETSP1346-20131115/4550_1 /ASSEMBLY_ACC=CAM_ASM_000771 /TAXON_ID=215587 /ORGANISM="Aplanochytrium stocchinoi, Strain GSBS06" /LENGTH=392 /DNA_ID=CAMNT_0051955219 /DNA_START=47 /DNA_END=1225 /DNA_ORIENTATION=-